MYVVYNKNLVVTTVSDTRISQSAQKQREVVGHYQPNKLIGRRLPRELLMMSDYEHREASELRIAFVCNWNDQCGISTYSKLLVTAVQPKVSAIRVFSETVSKTTGSDEDFVERCWQRGESLLDLADRIHKWGPDLVIIQHEFGIFPNAFHFMQFMEQMQNIPHVVTMHSVYQHLDKVVYTEAMQNIVVHSEAGRECLKNNGNTARVFVIPHGCIELENTDELWNICVSPYVVIQFGFGFRYKGVEKALHAISHLVKTDSKFKDLYYIYLCSENSFNKQVHDQYYDELRKICKELDIENNVCILRKYQTDEMLNLFLRLAKIAIFPYAIDPNNIVFGASGAIRVAMSNRRPVIASDSHMFDDLEGVVPRPSDYIGLASEIDEIFSNSAYRSKILARCADYVRVNNWDSIANQYVGLYNRLTTDYSSET